MERLRTFTFEAGDDASRCEAMKLTPGERILLSLELQELGVKLTDAIRAARVSAGAQFSTDALRGD